MPFRPVDPDDTDVTQAWIDDALLRVQTWCPGRIQTLHNDGTVDVAPLLRTQVPQPDGSNTFRDPPTVPRVPVWCLRAPPFAVTMPVAVGQLVILLACSGDIGTWFAGDGSLTTPGDLRRHHLAHVIAIPGIYPSAQQLQHPSSNLRIGLDTADASGTVEVTSDGDVILNGGTSPVAHEGSGTTGHAHSYALTAGPYAVTGTVGNVATGNTDMDTIATGQGSQTVKVPT